MNLKNLLIPVILLLSCKAFSQAGRTVTGVLLTTEHGPVTYASVSLVSSGVNTQSDAEGNFRLRYNGAADTLFVSHVGYTPASIPLGKASTLPLTIVLQRAPGMMQEVTVNTGYQQLPKERATGSFTQIDNATFNQQVSADVMSRLPAVANGLSEGRKVNSGNTNTGGKILIRGLSTINGPSSPLVILDNFPYDGDVNNINPNDVASITLLKDAAAASIWGTRAGNGVIVITTKKGRPRQKTRIELNSNIKFTEKPDLFYRPSISGADLTDLEQFLFSKRYHFSDTLNGSHPPISPVYEILLAKQNGLINNSGAALQLGMLRSYDVRNDFNKYVYRTGTDQQYALNLGGGADNMTWLLSGGFDKDVSVLSAGYHRANFRGVTTVKLTNRLQLTTSFYYTQSGATSGRDGYGAVQNSKGGLPVYTQLADATGDPLPFAKDYRLLYTESAGGGSLPDWNYYPLTEYRHNRVTNNVQDVLGNLSAAYTVSKNFNAALYYQYERQVFNGQHLYDGDSYYTRNLINMFYQPGATNIFPIPRGGILDVAANTLTSNNIRGQLNFNKSRGDHSVVAIAGAEAREIMAEGNSHRVYGYNSDLLTQVPVDYVNTYPSYVTGDDLNIPDNSGTDETINRFVSFFGNAAYTYQQKYTASISGRRDASNIFGVKINDKWNPLWSAGASWLPSREKYYHLGWLPFLKIRVTYGVSGNIDPSLSAITTLAYVSSSPYTMMPYAQVDKFYNPNLGWEKNRQLNFGVDFSTRHNLLSGSVDYYIKKGIDLYGPSPLDQTTGLGIGFIQKNAANMTARGLDVELHSINVNRAITWTTALNLSVYHDKITAYYQSSLQGSRFVADGITISGVVGKPVNSVFSYRWAGLDPVTGAPMGYLEGKVSEDYSALRGGDVLVSDLVYSGPGLPTVYGGLSNTVSYKGLSLTACLTYKFGYYFKKPGLAYASLFSSLTGSADYAKRWQNPGDEKITNVPSLVYPATTARDAFYNGSEVLVEKGDHVRLQFITLSYTMSRQGIKKLPFENITLYANVNDVGIIWRANKDGLDPGYTVTSIPPAKNIAAGLRITF